MGSPSIVASALHQLTGSCESGYY